MKQICNAEYWEHMPSVRDRTPGAPCGATFDDNDQSTLCPHEELPAGPMFLVSDKVQEFTANEGETFGEPMIAVSESDLAKIFEEWLRRYNEEPENFTKEYGEPETYGAGCAAYLIKLMEELT